MLGDRLPGVEDMKKLKYTTRVINEVLFLHFKCQIMPNVFNETLETMPIVFKASLLYSQQKIMKENILWCFTKEIF